MHVGREFSLIYYNYTSYQSAKTIYLSRFQGRYAENWLLPSNHGFLRFQVGESCRTSPLHSEGQWRKKLPRQRDRNLSHHIRYYGILRFGDGFGRTAVALSFDSQLGEIHLARLVVAPAESHQDRAVVCLAIRSDRLAVCPEGIHCALVVCLAEIHSFPVV